MVREGQMSAVEVEAVIRRAPTLRERARGIGGQLRDILSDSDRGELAMIADLGTGSDGLSGATLASALVDAERFLAHLLKRYQEFLLPKAM